MRELLKKLRLFRLHYKYFAKGYSMVKGRNPKPWEYFDGLNQLIKGRN